MDTKSVWRVEALSFGEQVRRAKGQPIRQFTLKIMLLMDTKSVLRVEALSFGEQVRRAKEKPMQTIHF